MSEKPKIDEAKIEKAIANSKASLRMEGLETSPEADEDCRKVLRGEMTDEEYIARVYERATGKKLQRDVNGNGRAK